MSEEIKMVACPKCGAKLTEGSRFCNICGASVVAEGVQPVTEDKKEGMITDAFADVAPDEAADRKKKKKSPKSKKHMEPAVAVSAEALYARGLSVEQGDGGLSSASVTKAKFSPIDLLSAISSKELINRIVVFVLAVALVALAFAPFAFSRANSAAGNTVKIGFSPKDNIELAVRSLFFLGDAELKNTDIYADLQSPSVMDELMQSSLMKKTLFLEVMSSGVEPRGTVLLAAVVAVAYFALCLLLLVFAFIDLLSEIITFKRKKDSKHICSRFSDTLLLVLLCLMPFFVFVFTQSCDMGVASVWVKYTGKGVGLAWGGILSITVALVGVLFIVCKNTFSLISRREKYFGVARIRNLICCVLVLLVIASAFMPCISLKVSNMSGDDKATVSVDFNELGEQTFDDISMLGKTSSDVGKYQLRDQISDVLDDIIFHKKGMGKTMLDTLLVKVYRINTQAFYIAIAVITALMLVCACIFLWALLVKVFQRARSGALIKVFRVLTLVFAGMDLIASIILAVSSYYTVSGALILMIEPVLGFGSVLMVIAMIATFFFRVDDKQIRVLDKSYDNADVSYAPYVIDK